MPRKIGDCYSRHSGVCDIIIAGKKNIDFSRFSRESKLFSTSVALYMAVFGSKLAQSGEESLKPLEKA